jgi:thiol-disulfide isomerase/thioredoxin
MQIVSSKVIMKKTISTTVALLLISTTISIIQAAFTDVKQDAWFAPYVARIQEEGIISGYRDTSGNLTGEFGPGETLTKAEAIKILTETKRIAEMDSNPSGNIGNAYSNLEGHHWGYGYLIVLNNNNPSITVLESELNQKADRNFVVTLTADILKLNNGSKTFTDIKNSKISAVADAGIISGYPDGSFGPNNNILRAEMAKIGTNILDYINGDLQSSTESNKDSPLSKPLSEAEGPRGDVPLSGTEGLEEGTDVKQQPFTFTTYTPETLDTWKNSNQKFALYFTAPWCPTCRALESKMNERIEEFPDNTTIINVDFDTNHPLRVEYGITIQTSFVFYNTDGTTQKEYNPTVDTILDLLSQ